ncbi:MAG TPA: TIGR03118 family protein [Rudaea sp.]|nr:TIGR03118 family protein [Rudaea sp.]
MTRQSCRIGYSVFISFSLACALGTAHARTAEDYYQQHNLVSDGGVAADHTDANLVNAWGIAFNPTGVAWVADNGTGSSTLYDGSGTAQSLVVQIPAPGAASGGTPTGIAFNGSNGFVVSGTGGSGPARFIFATEDGIIAGWSPTADGTHALTVVDNSATTHAVYKGLALSANGNGAMLYATDFHNARIDVFDSTFAAVSQASGAFVDPHMQSGFAPFGIAAIGGDLYVTFAKQDSAGHDEVDGAGLGYVDAFDPNGQLLGRIASRGRLNAPWGVALAPAGFGRFSNALIVGNFGDGRINAFDPIFRVPLGQLSDQNGKPIQIEGLWGLAFGNGFANQPVNTLFFAAGPSDESHGLYGRLDPVDSDNDGE